MKIKQIKTQYGFINYVEVAGIDLGKINDFDLKYNPEHMAYSKHIGKDARIDNLKNCSDLTDYEKENYSWYYHTVFSLPLEEVNKDWHIVNKDFPKNNEKDCEPDYLNRMLKTKICPVVIDDSSFMKWFVKIYPYLNDNWKIENSDYLKMMEERMLKNNLSLLEGFKNQDIKTIRSIIKLAADINFEEKGNSPIKYAVEYDNTELVKYLINKKITIPYDLVVDSKKNVADLLQKYVASANKKLKIK